MGTMDRKVDRVETRIVTIDRILLSALLYVVFDPKTKGSYGWTSGRKVKITQKIGELTITRQRFMDTQHGYRVLFGPLPILCKN